MRRRIKAVAERKLSAYCYGSDCLSRGDIARVISLSYLAAQGQPQQNRAKILPTEDPPMANLMKVSESEIEAAISAIRHKKAPGIPTVAFLSSCPGFESSPAIRKATPAGVCGGRTRCKKDQQDFGRASTQNA